MPITIEDILKAQRKPGTLNGWDILAGVGAGVDRALSTPGDYARGLVSARPGQRVSARELRDRVRKPNPGATGFEAMSDAISPLLLDAATDPLNLIGTGLASATARKTSKIEALNALSHKMRQAGAMPAEIVPKLHPSLLDETGQPRVLYHGTPVSGIEAQDLTPDFTGSSHDSGFLGKGVYFSPDKERAGRYALKGERGPRTSSGAVIQAFVDARNPMPTSNATDLFDTLASRGVPLERVEGMLARRSIEDSSRMTDAMRGLGHDSSMYLFNGIPDEVVAFDKSQIYAPYIAPALQQVPKNRLEALLLYNAAQGGRE